MGGGRFWLVFRCGNRSGCFSSNRSWRSISELSRARSIIPGISYRMFRQQEQGGPLSSDREGHRRRQDFDDCVSLAGRHHRAGALRSLRAESSDGLSQRIRRRNARRIGDLNTHLPAPRAGRPRSPTNQFARLMRAGAIVLGRRFSSRAVPHVTADGDNPLANRVNRCSHIHAQVAQAFANVRHGDWHFHGSHLLESMSAETGRPVPVPAVSTAGGPGQARTHPTVPTVLLAASMYFDR